MSDSKKQALRVGFNKRLKLELHGATIDSDATRRSYGGCLINAEIALNSATQGQRMISCGS